MGDKLVHILLPTQIGGPIEAYRYDLPYAILHLLLPTQIGGPIEAYLKEQEAPPAPAYCRLRSAAPLKRT